MRWTWIVFVLVGCAACSTKNDADKLLDREVTGQVLFETYTVEMTWGYKLSGMYIDADGTVWAYEQSGTPWYPEHVKPGELSQRDLLTKHKDPHQIGTVDRTRLRDMALLIKPASRGTVTHAAGSSVGDGSLEVAYLFDPQESTYQEIILAGQGNRVASNSAPEARVLLDYLREVQRLVVTPQR
jgi:hypothetical protein